MISSFMFWKYGYIHPGKLWFSFLNAYVYNSVILRQKYLKPHTNEMNVQQNVFQRYYTRKYVLYNISKV